jgi:uncharacterized protein DUF4153
MRTLQKPSQILLAALALGVCADQLFYGRWLGISAPLFVALGLAALAGLSAAQERPPARANLWVGAAALFFALCLAWRDAPFLVALNALAVLGLLAVLAASYRGESLARLPGERALSQTLVALAEIAIRPVPLAVRSTGQIRIEQAQTRRLLPVGRGLALAAPVVACFTVLLMAADSVFASYVAQVLSINLPFDLSTLLAHLTLTLAVGWACAGGLLVALLGEARSPVGSALDALLAWLIGLVHQPHAAPSADLPSEGATRPLALPRRPLISLGWVEALTVLTSVDVLFGGFMAIQGAYFFGGLDTLDRTGMTYAEYARRGFFELLAVACLALGMLCALAVVARRETRGQRQAFNIASAMMIALVMGLLASAFQRMLLYEHAYGYTQLRLYTHSFMIWLAVLLALFLLALLRERPQLFTFGGFISALAFLAVLNIANPDALIVQENVARYQASGKIDTYYLASLSADATPSLVAALGQLDGASRQTITDRLAQQLDRLKHAEANQGWPSWHLARARAAAAIEGAGRPADR